MNYFELYPGDYRRDTARLSLAEHGAYTLLLADYYGGEIPLPAPYADLYRIAGAQGTAEQKAVRLVADTYFPIGEDGLRHNSRADREIAKAQKRIQSARANGGKGGRPAKTHRVMPEKPTGFSGDNPAGTQPQTHSGEALHTPHAIPQQQEQKTAPKGVTFGDVSPQVVADFTAHRKAQRAPITQTGLDAIRREAGKAGLSLEAALAMCCARGWRGFKAEWVADQNARAGPNGSAPGKTMQALQTLEGMKNGLAANRDSDRLPETALLGFGPDPGR